jgi:hypothetical protein
LLLLLLGNAFDKWPEGHFSEEELHPVPACSGGTGTVHLDAPIIAERSAYVDAGSCLGVFVVAHPQRRERKSPSSTREKDVRRAVKK